MRRKEYTGDSVYKDVSFLTEGKKYHYYRSGAFLFVFNLRNINYIHILVLCLFLSFILLP